MVSVSIPAIDHRWARLPVTCQARPGDIIGFSHFSLHGAAINLATYGIPFVDLSHVGIATVWRGQLVICESTTESPVPCLVQGKHVSGVQFAPIDERVASYCGTVWHYPLRDRLAWHSRQTLRQFLLRHVGKPYDAIGAMRSAGVGLSWIESLLRPEDLTSIFCSELCAAAHRHVDRFDDHHVSRWNPNRFVRTERRLGVLGEPTRLRTG